MKISGGFDWRGIYDGINSVRPSLSHRPIIGITGNLREQTCTLAEGYYRSVLLAGGVPVVIPPYEQTELLADQLEGLDAIIFSGGGDINPLYLNEQPVRELHSVTPVRDQQELLLARLASDRQIPMLGICKGIQIIAAAMGGTLYQDINTQLPTVQIKHSQDLDRGTASHTISIEQDSLLYNMFGAELAVNSFHHQAVREVPQGFKVTAISPDGVIEAIESTEFKSIIGVQWHPECFCLNGDECMMPLFNWLVAEATSFRQAKQLHSHILSLDSHCDTPMFFDQGINFQSRDPKILVDLHKMTEGHLDASIMVAYLKQEARDDASLVAATKKADRILDEIEAMVAKSPDLSAIAYTPDDLYRNKREGRKSIMLGIENGYAIGKCLDNVERFRKSHASEKSFYDAGDISNTPIVCSHSSARALCDHPRDLTDDQLRRLAQCGGVAQVTFYDGFLRKEGGATIIDAVKHLNHMVDIMGVEHVGIGTDFDGDGGVPGVASASELINFTRRLLAERYSANDIELIWGANFLRVMKLVQTH